MRIAFALFLLTASEVAAEVCDRSKFALNDSIEGSAPITRDRIDFSFESGVIEHQDGAKETVYCIRNNHDEFPVYVKWHGPNPKDLFVDYAAANGKWGAKVKKRYEQTDSAERLIEFGTTNSYGEEEDIDTMFFAAGGNVAYRTRSKPLLVPVQATPLDLVQKTFPEVLQDPIDLERFLDAYRVAPQGGNEIVIYSYSAGWIPAEVEVLAQFADGIPPDNYDGPYVPISYGIRSALDTETRVATTSTLFWIGHFTTDAEALGLTKEFGTLNDLSLVTLDTSFDDVRQLAEGSFFELADISGQAQQTVNVVNFGDGGTGQIVPWSIGIAYKGQAFSAIHAEILEN